MIKLLLGLLALSTSAFGATRNIPVDTLQPSLQASAPGSPTAGTIYNYFLNADGFPYWKTSGGTVYGYLYSSSNLTNHGLLVGAGTRQPTALSVASSNTVLVGNSGADPSFRQIVNADVDNSAAIAYSKLSLGSSITSSDITDGTIVNADVSASAAIAYSKLNLASSIVSSDITDGTIVNADIDAAAAIAGSKLQAANGTTNAGAVSTGAQDIGGEKRFLSALGMAEVSTPSNPSAGYRKLYFKSDGKLYKLDSSGTETEIGAGSGGGVNTITSCSFALASYGGSANQYYDLCSVSLVAGTYCATANTYWDSTGSTSTTEITIGVSTSSGNNFPEASNGTNINEVVKFPVNNGSGNTNPGILPCTIISPASTTTYYFKGYLGSSVANQRVGGKFTAILLPQ